MRPYPKTENLYHRSDETHKLIPGSLRQDENDLISYWLVTEKIDGTNIRVILDLHGRVDVRGRSDNANVPGDLSTWIESKIEQADIPLLFEYLGCDDSCFVTLYGEGYGAGIQKVGRQYSPDKKLRLFDVVTTRYTTPETALNWWRPWGDVLTAAAIIGIKTVPYLGTFVLDGVYDYVKRGYPSVVADHEAGNLVLMEGVIARTDPYLYNWRGDRVLFKLKGVDLP